MDIWFYFQWILLPSWLQRKWKLELLLEGCTVLCYSNCLHLRSIFVFESTGWLLTSIERTNSKWKLQQLSWILDDEEPEFLPPFTPPTEKQRFLARNIHQLSLNRNNKPKSPSTSLQKQKCRQILKNEVDSRWNWELSFSCLLSFFIIHEFFYQAYKLSQNFL